MTIDSPPRPTEGRAALPPRFARLRGLTAVFALLAAIAGVPAALLFLGSRLPLDTSVLTSDALLRPDDGRLLILVLYAVGWGAWAVFAASVSLEIVAVVRGIPAPHLPGFGSVQRMAAGLVATAALLGVASPITPEAHAVEAAPPVVLADSSADPASGASVASKASTQPTARDRSPEFPTITVQRHDTLWALADRHLGDGARYTEILELNRGRPQPDGRRLENPSWLYPGWVLRLPADARVTRTGQVSGDPQVVVVERGDTLWEIAEDELGDGTRYPEIFRENVGEPQPDGQRLTDPDVILVGWELDIPGTVDEGSPAESHPVQSAGDVTPTPDAADGQRGTLNQPDPTPETEFASPPESSLPDVERDGATPQAQQADASAQPEDDSPDEFDELDEPDEAPPSSGLVALGISGIALAGFVGEVGRRRLCQQRVRRPGERIPMPAGNAADLEAKARALSDLPRAELTQQALRAMAESARQEGRRLPDVRTVRITSDTIELDVHGDGQALAPFKDRGDGTWLLDAEQLATATYGSIDPYPTLVAVGADGDDVILLNLESVGGLAVTGDNERVVLEVVRALATDLALAPGQATVLLHGVLADLVNSLDPGRIVAAPDGGQIERRVKAHRRLLQGQFPADPDANLRWLRLQSDSEVALGCLAVVSTALKPAPPEPWSGVVRIQPGEFVDGGGEFLTLRSDGMAVLERSQLLVNPAVLTESTVDTVAEVLDTADQPSVPARATAPSLARFGDSQPDVTRHGPRVLLLGRVEVVDVAGRCVEQRIARLTETVAYLALHPGATREELAEAIWQGRRVEQSTKRNLVSRTRTWLGVDEEGRHYLETVPGHGADRLRLSDSVTTDWAAFTRYLSAARERASDEALHHLEAALDLVRGRPFLGINPSRYVWAERPLQEMVSSITDAALMVADIHMANGDHERARVVVTRALSVDWSNDRLVEIAIQACQRGGDAETAARLVERHERLLDDLADPATAPSAVGWSGDW